MAGFGLVPCGKGNRKKKKKDLCVQYGMTFHVSAKVVNELMQPLRAALIESHLSDSMATERIFKISVLLKLSLKIMGWHVRTN